jgi:predicted Zn-dependent peptidase
VSRACAAVLAALLAAAPASAQAAAGDLPDLGPATTVARLQAGGMAIVDPLGGAPVAAVELWYRAPSTGFGAKPVSSLARLAAQAVAASKPLVGPAVGELVNEVGGRLTISVFPDSIEISALVPSSAAQRAVRAMTTAFFAPVLTDDGFHSAQRDVAEEAALETFNPETLLRDSIFSELFSGGPQHVPPLGDPKQVAEVNQNDVRAFATRAFRSQNAVLVVSGTVDSAIVASAATGRPETDDAGKPEAPAVAQLAAKPGEPVQKVFDIPATGYGWVGPRITDERDATALDFIADYLFRPETGVVSRELAASDPDAFVTGQFITLHDPGVVFVAYAGKRIDAVRAAVERGLASAHKPLAPQAFALARIAFEYNLLHELQTPSELADNFGWYSVEGNPAYAPGAGGRAGEYFKAADSLTPEFVASVADKYLTATPAVANLRPQTAANGASK